jgi:hypothetical protein
MIIKGFILKVRGRYFQTNLVRFGWISTGINFESKVIQKKEISDFFFLFNFPLYFKNRVQ